MPKFTYDDIVRVKPTVTVWGEVPKTNTIGPRIGERAWVYAVSENDPREKFAAGTVYGIELEDGASIEVHEDDLELAEGTFGE